MQKIHFFLFLLISAAAYSQDPSIQITPDTTVTGTVKKESPFKSGYYPVGFFDIDLKYIIKYNNYEGFRLGVGGVTNDKLFEKYRIGGYVAFGFKDKTVKYSVGGGARVNKEKKAWVNAYYTDDIREVGTFDYLTDARVYSVFEPRLVNIIQFYKFKTIQANIQSELTPKILAEFRLAHSSVRNILDYAFAANNDFYTGYQLAEATIGGRISPKTEFFTNEDGTKEYYDGLPKVSAQITQGVKGIAGSDFDYTKFGLKFDYYIKRTNLSSTNILLEGLLAKGDVPLTHLFHAYPNQPVKSSIDKRFSVAGVQSFETMYFGEFFSDKLTTLQIKHSLRRFNIAKRLKPEFVFITRHALGNLSDKNRHLGLDFNTLDQVYSETGFELNKLIFGFGLSAAYRYGFYHLPQFEDNISFKFTFYLKV